MRFHLGIYDKNDVEILNDDYVINKYENKGIVCYMDGKFYIHYDNGTNDDLNKEYANDMKLEVI